MQRCVPVFALLLAAALCLPSRAEAAEIILYDLFNFQGQAVTLTESAPDLDQYGFDNDLESFRILSGTWSIHRDDNFQNGNGPPLVLGPGQYPNIEALGFPQDRASSVQLVQDTQPPAAECLPPYQTVGRDGRCVFTCGEGTVGNPATGECVCANRGLVETGVDDQGRRVCGPRATDVPEPSPPVVLEPPTAPMQAFWVDMTDLQINDGAYQTADRDVRLSANFTASPSFDRLFLEYRVVEGPLVYDDASKLQLLSTAPWTGFISTDIHYGRQDFSIPFQLGASAGDKVVYFQLRAVDLSHTSPRTAFLSPVYLDTIVLTAASTSNVVHQVAAADAFGVAKAAGFTFDIQVLTQDSTLCALQSVGTRLVFSVRHGLPRGPGQLVFPGRCVFSLFGGRELTPGWSFGQPTPISAFQCPAGSAEHLNVPDEAVPPYRVNVFADFNETLPGQNCSAHRWAMETILLIGPAGADWRIAFGP